MNRSIIYIEGIGQSYARALKAIGIYTTENLLQMGANKDGRLEISKLTSISEKKILKWVNMCDLFRIKGIAGQFAELLESSDINTISELRFRDPDNLAKKMKQINNARKLCKVSPSLKSVTSWIEQAKSLPSIIKN